MAEKKKAAITAAIPTIQGKDSDIQANTQANTELINRITSEFNEKAQDDVDRKIVRASDLLKRKV